MCKKLKQRILSNICQEQPSLSPRYQKIIRSEFNKQPLIIEEMETLIGKYKRITTIDKNACSNPKVFRVKWLHCSMILLTESEKEQFSRYKRII